MVVGCAYTGSRSQNVKKFHPSQISDGVWNKGKTKNGEIQSVPLVTQALELVEDFEGFQDHYTYPWQKLMKAAKLEDFLPHDLRRVTATAMFRTGAREFEIKTVLGHAMSEVTNTYVVVDMESVRAALQKAVDEMLKP